VSVYAKVIQEAADALRVRGLTKHAGLFEAAAHGVRSACLTEAECSRAAACANELMCELLDFATEPGEPGDVSAPLFEPSADDRAAMSDYFAQRREEEANFERGFAIGVRIGGAPA
jgi:hypothetical protein